MTCPDCHSDREHIIRSADEMFLPPEMRPAGLFAWVLRCWQCGRNESGYTTLRLRPATMDDAQFLFDVRNDPETRRQSFTSAPLNYDAHCAWLTIQLRSVSHIWIAEIAGEKVGYLRYLPSFPPELSYAVAPQWRRCGIGTAMLALSPGGQGTTARVKGLNQASHHAFQKAGWQVQEVVYVK